MKFVKNILAISLVIIESSIDSSLRKGHAGTKQTPKTAEETKYVVNVLFKKFDEIINDKKSERDKEVDYAHLFITCDLFVCINGGLNVLQTTQGTETVDTCARGVWFSKYATVFHQRHLWKTSGAAINEAIQKYLKDLAGNKLIPIKDYLHEPSKEELHDWSIIS